MQTTNGWHNRWKRVNVIQWNCCSYLIKTHCPQMDSTHRLHSSSILCTKSHKICRIHPCMHSKSITTQRRHKEICRPIECNSTAVIAFLLIRRKHMPRRNVESENNAIDCLHKGLNKWNKSNAFHLHSGIVGRFSIPSFSVGHGDRCNLFQFGQRYYYYYIDL